MMPKILAIAFVSLFITSAGMCAECDVCKVANQKTNPNYVESTGMRLVQGATNVGFSWMELFLQPLKAQSQAKKGECPVRVGLGGLANGVGSMCYHALQGSGQIVTAFFPQRVMAAAPCEVCDVEKMKEQAIVS